MDNESDEVCCMKKRIGKISILILVIVLIIAPLSITIGAHHYYFGNRINHSNAYFEYLISLDDSFKKDEVCFPSDEGQLLHGAFYYTDTKEQSKGLIVWVHGMGVNHENYLAEIQLLTKEGYVVFSYDNTGVDHSEGDSLKGLSQSVIDLQYASNYLFDLDLYNDIPNILIGHSWGGYAVASVSSLDLPREYDGIVSLAGFYRNINVIEDILSAHIGMASKLLIPYLTVYERIIFGNNASLNGIDGLYNTDAKVLLIHSKDDEVVLYDNNFEVYKNEFIQDDRFQFIEYVDAGHKLTINYESYMRIHDIMHHQMELEQDSDHYGELELERLSLITDFNNDVMYDIISFCNDICN